MTDTADSFDTASILLVDDQPGNLLALKAVLERPDYDLVLARDGREALLQVLRHDFAVIILDVAMPGMDGFEVAATLKQRASYRTIPIIFVTASVQHIEWIYKGYDVGAVDFLQKPLDPNQVRAKVAVFVELQRQRRQIERQSDELREKERRAQALEIERLGFQHERRFRNLAEAIPHVVWVATAGGDIEYVNRGWSHATGASEQAAKGRSWMALVHPDDIDGLAACWEQFIRSGDQFEVQFRLRTPGGSFRWQHARALPERENGRGVVRWLGTFTDVDEHRRAQEELEAAVRLRDEFLAVASHELQTPLTALKLRVESLRRTGYAGTSAERLDAGLFQALKQVERLTVLIDRLLDVSRLSADRPKLALEDFDLAALASEVVRGLSDELSAAGCALELRVTQPVRGTWDRLRIGQVITNLLSNAMKYGAGKPIEVEVASDDGKARLVVRDHGIGISPEQLGRIFGAFERAAPVQHYGGLGLGLYVVAQVVEAHGGRVDVDTRPGEGATFVVTLPRAVSSSAPVHAA